MRLGDTWRSGGRSGGRKEEGGGLEIWREEALREACGMHGSFADATSCALCAESCAIRVFGLHMIE